MPPITSDNFASASSNRNGSFSVVIMLFKFVVYFKNFPTLHYCR